jgi:hypothetical protein
MISRRHFHNVPAFHDEANGLKPCHVCQGVFGNRDQIPVTTDGDRPDIAGTA